MKNILIGVLVVAVLVLGYLQFGKNRIVVGPTKTDVVSEEKSTDNTTFKTYNIGFTTIQYDAAKWKIDDIKYCTPAQEAPCPIVGYFFTFKNGNNDDTITMGGYQPMACSDMHTATKCSDAYSMSTSSHNQEVLNFYDYLLSFMP